MAASPGHGHHSSFLTRINDPQIPLTRQKILRFPHLPLPRTCALSLTWQVARAGIDPTSDEPYFLICVSSSSVCIRVHLMKSITRSLRRHRELILNYFRAQKLLSSGVVEGLNNKAKVTMRESYGFRTFRCLELALYHSLGKLPEPESTHEFF